MCGALLKIRGKGLCKLLPDLFAGAVHVGPLCLLQLRYDMRSRSVGFRLQGPGLFGFRAHDQCRLLTAPCKAFYIFVPAVWVRLKGVCCPQCPGFPFACKAFFECDATLPRTDDLNPKPNLGRRCVVALLHRWKGPLFSCWEYLVPLGH